MTEIETEFEPVTDPETETELDPELDAETEPATEAETEPETEAELDAETEPATETAFEAVFEAELDPELEPEPAILLLMDTVIVGVKVLTNEEVAERDKVELNVNEGERVADEDPVADELAVWLPDIVVDGDVDTDCTGPV